MPADGPMLRSRRPKVFRIVLGSHVDTPGGRATSRSTSDRLASMPTPPTPTPPAASGFPPQRSGNRTVVVLLIVVALLVAVIVALLLTRGKSGPSATEASSSPPTSSAAPPPSAAEPGTSPTAEPTPERTSAPTLTDSQSLEIAHNEITRDPDDPRAQGSVDAPVVMVLYSDFACPYCTVFAQEVEPQLEDLVADGMLRIEWRDLAQITETSPLAAQAGIAAGNQGKFWEFHDVVYAAADPQAHPDYTEDSLVDFAQQAGVPDLDRFRADMNDPATASAVSEATNHAHSLGIQGTPFLIINDAVIAGYRPVDYVRATIAEQATNAS